MGATKTMLMAAVAVCGLAISMPAMVRAEPPTSQPAHQGGPRGERGPGFMIMAALKDLNLTDEQKAKVKPILEDAKAKMDAWREAHKDAIAPIIEEMKAAHESGDKDKMAAARAKMQDLRKDAPNPKELFEQIKAVLTPDQADKFEAAIKAAREKMGGPGGGPGGAHHQHGGGGAPASGQ